jgi:hypothetical protein
MYQNINYHDRQHEQRISAEKLSKNFEALKKLSSIFSHVCTYNDNATALQCIPKNLTPWRDSNPGSSLL